MSFAIPLKTIAAMFVIMFTLSTIIFASLVKLTETFVEDQVEYLAKINSSIASEYLEAMQIQSKFLASELKRYSQLDEQTAQKLIKSTLLSSLDDERIFSSYVALEPNKYFKNTANGLSYYAYRSGTSINFDTFNDYNTYNTGDYYAASKKSLKAHITEPYSYELSNGETVWLITISNPIMGKNDEFLGVSNCDILADTVNNLSYDLNDYKTAYSFILTNSSTYVTNTLDKSLFGTKFETLDTSVSESITNGTKLKTTNNNLIEIYEPMPIKGTDSNWTSAFVVSKSEAFSGANKIIVLFSFILVLAIIILAISLTVLLRKALKPVKDILLFSQKLGEGDLSADLKIFEDNELGDISISLKNTATSLNTYVNEISYILGEISNNNLNVTTSCKFTGGFIPIEHAIKKIIHSLNNTMNQIKNSSIQVAIGAGQISSGVQSLSQSVAEQASSVEELSAAVQNVSDHAKSNAEYVHNALNYVDSAVASINESDKNMDNMISSMQAITDSSNEIKKIIKVIDEIAFQTNILALNAAVEAARAGVSGKGFAVVADEVRNLAIKSAQAAKQTDALIEKSLKTVLEGTKTAEITAKSLHIVSKESSNIKTNIDKIDASSYEQSTALSQINEGLNHISQAIMANSATAEENAASSEELFSQSETLHNKVSKFKLNEIPITD